MPTSMRIVANAYASRAAVDDELGPDGKKIRPGISADLRAVLSLCGVELSWEREKRQIPPTLAPVDAVERYTPLNSYHLHKTNEAGILSIDIHQSKDIIASGGDIKVVVILDRSSGEILSTLSGHSKKVTSMKFVAEGDIIVTGSADKTVRLWQGSENGNYDCKHVLRDHTAEVNAITLHAANNHFVTASLDKTWCFYELHSGLCLMQVADSSISEGYTCAAFHPDGLRFGTGTSEAIIKLWDVKTQAVIAQFPGHVGAATAIAFSNNGHLFATAGHDKVKLWDLRKLTRLGAIKPHDKGTLPQCVEFDHSGRYLAIGGSDIRVYQVGEEVESEWKCIKTFPDLSGTGFILSCTQNKNTKRFLFVRLLI